MSDFVVLYGLFLYRIQHTHARAHATISSTFCSEKVLILSILGLGYNSCIVFKNDLDLACLYCCLAGLNEN